MLGVVLLPLDVVVVVVVVVVEVWGFYFVVGVGFFKFFSWVLLTCMMA